MSRYQIWGDNRGSKHGFQSYVNGYIENKKEAEKKFRAAKRDWKEYHHIELHEVDFNGKKLRTLISFKRKSLIKKLKL